MKLTDSKLKNIAIGLSEIDKSIEPERNKKGIIYDDETKETEIVPISEDIDDYMKRKVLPYIPDACAFLKNN